MAATADAPFWFDPCLEFGLDEPRPDAGTLPLLLVLPGADGSGITAWMQFPSLAQEYAVRALCVPAGDRSSHADLVALVSQEVRSVGEGRELFLLGESMGSGVAIDVALDVPQELSGLLLVSPATGWHRKLGYRILTWRDSVLVSNRGPWPALLQLVLTLSSYVLLDAAQVSLPRLHLGRTSAAPRLHLGCTSVIIARAARRRAGRIHLPTAAHRREVAPSARRGADEVRLARRHRAAGKTRPLPGDGLAPQGLGGAHVRRRQTGGRAAGPGAVRGRDSRPPRACRGRGSTLRARGLSHAAASPPCLDPSEPSLGRVSTCLGYISDTSNPATLFRVPLDCKVSRCRCVYVEGAGHAGATDDRLDLRAELAAWRREVIEVSRKEPTTAATV